MDNNNSHTSPNILLLQGPLGCFNVRLARHFKAQGCQVFQVALNGGDALFAHRQSLYAYQGTLEDWPAYIAGFMHEQHISDVICFSDCRAYHKLAKEEANKQGLRFWVLEEGYLRPDFFTLEQSGVNALSLHRLLSTKIANYNEAMQPAPYQAPSTFGVRAWSAIAYYVAKRFMVFKYKHYKHHRARTEVQEGLSWVRSGYRKLGYKYTQRHFLQEIKDTKYYVLILQMHEDFQLREHSQYSAMTEVIAETMSSFAQCAPDTARLVIKHHPIDRGFHHYGDYIQQLEYSLNLAGRVDYVHDVHLPTLLRACQGVVTVNSTVGLSTLAYGRPVKVLGRAIYDLPEVCFAGALDDFWLNAGQPNAELVDKLKAYLRNKTQVNGSLYKDLDRSAAIVVKKIVAATHAEAEPQPIADHLRSAS